MDEQGLQERVHAGVAEAQSGDAGSSSWMMGVVRSVKAFAPRMGSWLTRWTPRRRRLAVKLICRRAGRFVSRFESPKSLVSLMVVSVLIALPSLWYCLILAFL